jgi:hypothetical protein
MPGAGRLAGARVSTASFFNLKTWMPAFAGMTTEVSTIAFNFLRAAK